MSNKIKFHLDENVGNAIATGLRIRGIDTTTSPEEGLIGASDEQQLAFCLSEKRVIFTFDDDFLKNPHKLFEMEGNSGLGGHFERIHRYAKQQYANDYFSIIP